MGTFTPQQLLALWKREEPSPETVIGHIIQNLVRMQQAHDAHNLAHYSLKGGVDHTKDEVARLKREVARLKADLGQLRADFEVFKKAHTQPPAKGEKKPSTKRKSDDDDEALAS